MENVINVTQVVKFAQIFMTVQNVGLRENLTEKLDYVIAPNISSLIKMTYAYVISTQIQLFKME